MIAGCNFFLLGWIHNGWRSKTFPRCSHELHDVFFRNTIIVTQSLLGWQENFAVWKWTQSMIAEFMCPSWVIVWLFYCPLSSFVLCSCVDNIVRSSWCSSPLRIDVVGELIFSPSSSRGLQTLSLGQYYTSHCCPFIESTAITAGQAVVTSYRDGPPLYKHLSKTVNMPHTTSKHKLLRDRWTTAWNNTFIGSFPVKREGVSEWGCNEISLPSISRELTPDADEYKKTNQW